MYFSEVSPRYRQYKVNEVKAHWLHQHYSTSSAPGYPELIDRERIGPQTPEGNEYEGLENNNNTSKKKTKSTAKRRNRRNKLKSLLRIEFNQSQISEDSNKNLELDYSPVAGDEKDNLVENKETVIIKMADNKSRDDVLAARQAKKQSKQKGKGTDVKNKPAETKKIKEESPCKPIDATAELPKATAMPLAATEEKHLAKASLKSKDEVDKVTVKVDSLVIDDKEQIKAERAAKKAAKQAKKKSTGEVPKVEPSNNETKEVVSKPANENMTVKDVAETLRDIVSVVKDINEVTDKVKSINLGGRKPVEASKDKTEKSSINKIEEISKDKIEEGGKSKAELKAERRAKQEAQRAAKQGAQVKEMKPKIEAKVNADRATPSKEVKGPKQKSSEKSKPKSQCGHRLDLFQHSYNEHNKQELQSLPINSHLHPAIIKLGVQLSSRVVTGSNARCVALLDALKKMVRDYTLPAKTEFSRGLESHLASSLEFLWSMRPPSASQTNAVKFFRYHLTQLPNNVDEFDAKKTLQEEIDRYIREQIDMAGEAISIAVRNKISKDDNILTYGCSSLIERILREAWSAGVHFHTVVVGNRVNTAATQMLRRLVAHGLPCTYIDITALSSVMHTINKVVLGASALLATGAVLGAVGTAPVCLAARARNVPVLVACETHKFSDKVHTDAVVCNEIGDPDDLIDKSDDNSPLKDWRSNPNLTPLNLTYDVTPASLVTAVVTELAILPCTSAPVVLRFKLSEYSV